MANDIDESKLSAEDRAKRRRARQTLNNLLLSLAACLGIVLGLVLIVPRDDSNRIQPVDYVTVAKSAAESSGEPVLVPELLNSDWWSNSARWRSKSTDGVDSWYVGFVGKSNQFIGLTQAFDSNPTWLVLFLKESLVTGTETIAGRSWQVYESVTKNNPAKSRDYALVTELEGDQIIVYGTASKSELVEFVTSLEVQLQTKYQK